MANQVPSIKDLEFVTTKLKAADLRFALGGSGMLYAHGLVDDVNDWDLVTDASFDEVAEALDGLTWRRVAPSAQFSSDFLIQVQLNGSVIEIIGGFKIQLKNGSLFEVPFVVAENWNNIPLSDPLVWLEAYKAMERPHRAVLLEQFLQHTM